jgi:hypothetical protein
MNDACEFYAQVFPDLLQVWIEEGAVVCGDIEFGGKSFTKVLGPLERAVSLHGEDKVLAFIFGGGGPVEVMIPAVSLPPSFLLGLSAMLVLAIVRLKNG